MKNNQTIAIAVIAIAFLSCKGGEVVATDPNISFKNCRTIVLDPKDGKTIELSAIAKEINIVPLESAEEALVADISKILYDDGLYFIQNRNSREIFVFDSLGNYRNNIWRQGRGPGEVLFPGSFALSPADKTVWVIDNSNSVKKYSYDGGYRETIQWDLFMRDFYINENGSLYCYTEKAPNWKDGTGQDYWCNELTIIDSDNEKHRYIQVDTALYSKEGRLTLDTFAPFSVLPGSVTFHHTISDVIYSIDRTTDEVTAKYSIDFGGKKFKTDIAKIPTMEVINYMVEHPGEAGWLRNVVESENYLTFNYVFMNEACHVIYNKQDDSFVEGVLTNDLFTTPIRLLYQHDGIFLGVMGASEEMGITDKGRKILPQNVIDVLNNIGDSDNPLLVEVRL